MLAPPALAAEPTRLCPSQKATVAVVGDSLADGLWGSLYRQFMGCQTVAVLRVTTVSDGLTRTTPEDWAVRLSDAMGAAEGADLVLVQIGANDIQPIRDGSTRAVFRDPAWDSAYRDRAAALTTALRGHLALPGGKLLWLGLPVVGDAVLEPEYRHVTTLQQEAVAQATASGKSALFVDIHTPTMFGTTAYTQTADLGDGLQQLRATDQIHFTELGYDLVLGMVWPEVEAVLKAKDAEAGLDALALQ